MPILATPMFDAGNGTTTCNQQANKTPAVATVYGVPTPARRQAVQFTQGQSPTITWQLVDDQGNTVDLSGCGAFDDSDGSGVTLQVCDSFLQMPYASAPRYSVDGTVAEPHTGVAVFELPTQGTAYPGIYLAEAVVVNSDGGVVFSNQFYLVINRGQLGAARAPSGMPSIAEIRLHLRDSDPGDNPLLEAMQFDLAELVLAIERPVLYWNESPPPINVKYTTLSFPFRYYWLEGIVSQLYFMAAHFYRRNALLFQSQGGIGVNDLNKAQEYEQIGQAKWQEYKTFIQQAKVNLNAEACIQSTFSPYIYSGPW